MYVKFAREKEALFDHWCTAKQVDNDYPKLRQLLVEEFKKCLQSDVKMYLDEQKTDSLHQAAVLADDYSLTHKMTFPSKSDQPGVCSNVPDCKNSDTDSHSPPTTRSRYHGQGNSRMLAGGLVYYYCKKYGHTMAECRALERKNAIKTPNALVVLQKTWQGLQLIWQVTKTNAIILSFPRALFPHLRKARRFQLT